ncbi:MAG: 4-hydroxy-tetrahydrodipicolinate synthase [Anaeroplasmataceae bacterium]|nr:4-hydroxy-tetrahydrodipicolinate synthase [Anaeroplasmataceae bacterium]
MLKGSFVALVTPFLEDGSIHYDKLKELLEYHLNNHTDGIVLLGTTGEASTIPTDEKLKIVKFAIKIINHQIPLIVGAGSNDTLASLEFIEKLNHYDIDAYLCITPYYNKTNQAGLVHHFEMLADKAKCPIILYHVPSRTGMHMSIDTVEALSHHPNIIGIKEASGDIGFVCEVSKIINDSFVMFSGNDNMIVPMMACGAVGVISVLANICPKNVHKLCELCFNAKYVDALALQNELLDVANALFIETNPIPIKEAMNYLGFQVGKYHMPLYPMSDENKKKLLSTLDKYQMSII